MYTENRQRLSFCSGRGGVTLHFLHGRTFRAIPRNGQDLCIGCSQFRRAKKVMPFEFSYDIKKSSAKVHTAWVFKNLST